VATCVATCGQCESTITRLRDHLSYGITQCYLPPDRGDSPNKYKTSTSAHADGTRAKVHREQSTIALHAECYQLSAIVVDCRPHLPCTSAVGPLPPVAVNTRLTAVTVYIAFADSRRAVAKFFQSTLWDQIAEGSALIFGDTLISLKHSLVCREKPICKNSSTRAAISIQYCTCDRQTHTNTDTQLITTLAWRHAVIYFY